MRDTHKKLARRPRVRGKGQKHVLVVTGVEVSERADFSEQFVKQLGGASRIVRDDFYTVDLDGRFDVVCYWNGFGIGSDADQRTLLRRVAEEWLTDSGVALIDISNPFVWACWDGEEEHKPSRPGDGYDYDLCERTHFDPIRSRFADTWWVTDDPGETWTQNIRCYTPADLRLLLEGTGPTLDSVLVAGEVVDLDEPQLGLASLLREAHEYLAVLTSRSPAFAHRGARKRLLVMGRSVATSHRVGQLLALANLARVTNALYDAAWDDDEHTARCVAERAAYRR